MGYNFNNLAGYIEKQHYLNLSGLFDLYRFYLSCAAAMAFRNM